MALDALLLMFQYWLVLVLLWLQLGAAEVLAPITGSLPGCPDKCGDINIPYPFGIGEGCYMEGFSVTCDETFSPPILLDNLRYGQVEILDISLRDSITTVKLYIMNSNIAVPALFPWMIGGATCNEARNLTSYACRDNTNCSEQTGNVPGYVCQCNPGYEGNPYLKDTPGGCQDIDECKDPDANPCKGFSAYICKNTEGGHECICPPHFRARTRYDGSIDCVKPGDELWKIFIGTSSGLLFLLVASWLYWVVRKKKLMQLKEKFFQQNGGLILQRLLKSEKSADGSGKFKIFTAAELSKATKQFDESRILGQGGYGTVYKGILSNGNVVAIKKSVLVDRTQVEQFINLVVVLSRINHRNVVKLLGCCLETEDPFLVYEFVAKGALFQHLHGRENRVSKLSWVNRLRIAAEAARSLAYLHSSASIPIIHRNVKSSNILLDNSYTAKVSDFGASRLVSTDQTQLTTLIQGTLGYLDPEYFHTSQLTEKSDVYSFGVVLAELLTGKKAFSIEKPEAERSLAGYFLSSTREDRLFQILDESLACEGHTEQEHIKEVAELTKRCLRGKGEKRPTMKEVAMVLDGLIKSSKNPWILDVEPNSKKEEKAHSLVDIELDSYAETSTSSYVTQESRVMQVPLIHTGR